MSDTQIEYRDGYKYRLCADYSIEIPILLAEDISCRFIKLTKKGLLTARADYCWDGLSGPTADTKSSMRASLIHDVLYQLIREGLLDSLLWRAVADRIFLNCMLIDKVFPSRAQLFYRGVCVFGEPACDPAMAKPVLTAP